MPYQSNSLGYLAYKVQGALGTQATGGSGTVLRTAGGQGTRMTKASQESAEVRRDGMSSRGRHGTQSTTGQWLTELSIGSQEPIIEALLRGTWGSITTITEATAGLTSITTTANTIVASAGSWITAGVRVGDVARLTNHTTAGNNSRNLRITGVTASTLTVAETLTLNATPDTSFTLTLAKKLICPAAGSLVKRYYTTEEYYLDLDSSEVMTDFVFGGAKFSMQANGIIMMDVSGVGTGRYENATGASSPILTSPTESTSVPLSVSDSTLRFGSNDQLALTSFDITIDNQASAGPVFGSGGIKYSPDVFTGQLRVGINFTGMRKDLQYLADLTAETVYSLQVLAVENESEPKDYISIYVPNFTLGGVDRSALSNKGGGMTETITVPAALVGIDSTGGAFDPTMIKFQSTGA